MWRSNAGSTEGLVDGVRIDHPDGLSDPAGYLTWLREITGPQAWIVIEKILAVDEPLDPSLPVAGTTGYDALREIGGLFVDPAGVGPLTDLVDSTGTDYHAMPRLARELKADAVTDTLGSELRRLCRTIVDATGFDHPRLPDAIAALLSRIGVYRSDYLNLSSVLPTALAETVTERPELAEPLAVVSAAAADGGEAAVRLQQLCGAATAKSMEDCLFYRDPRLVSLNEVGGEPDRFGVSLAEFHQRAVLRARLWPHAMTALSTHDTKRGEDVRARIGVLSQVPSLWAEFVGAWEQRTPSPDPMTGLFLWQNIFGVWPVDGTVTDDLRGRLHAYAEKAIREAAVNTSWHDPDTGFESAVHNWIDAVTDGPIAAELTSLVARLDEHARNDSLGQKLIGLTAPGVPDVYQGTELFDDSLVDPDNRRPVDYQIRREALVALTDPKIRVVTAALRSRRDRPTSFTDGGYTPLLAEGPAAATPRGVRSRRRRTDGGDTSFREAVRNRLGRHCFDPSRRDVEGPHRHGPVQRPVPAAELFAELPVALLERVR